MSKPRYKWWGYVKWVIRDYPAKCERFETLSGWSAREYAAVKVALCEAEQLPEGVLITRLVDLIFLRNTHTLQGAAMVLHISERTAERWHGNFIRAVAHHLGFLD